MKVLRARVTKNSRLVGKTVADVQFRDTYKAAILVVQQGGKNVTQSLSSLTFGAGDILILQVSDDCPLLSSLVASTKRKPILSTIVPSLHKQHLDVEVCIQFSQCYFGNEDFFS